jgi:hypothetical protein
MINFIIYDSITEKIQLRGREKNGNIITLFLVVHHGAPLFEDLFEKRCDLTNVMKLAKKPTEYIRFIVSIQSSSTDKCRISIEREPIVANGEPPQLIYPEDIEDIIKYLHRLRIIKKINYKIDLQDKKNLKNFQYEDKEEFGSIEFSFTKRDITDSCILTLHKKIELSGYYDPTVLLGLTRIATKCIEHGRKVLEKEKVSNGD